MDSVHRTNAGADLVTDSTDWSPMDPALSIALSTGARRARLQMSGRVASSLAGQNVRLCFAIDGVLLAQVPFEWSLADPAESYGIDASLVTRVLTAGPHTFQPFWAKGAGHGEVSALQGAASEHLIFSVSELPAS